MAPKNAKAGKSFAQSKAWNGSLKSSEFEETIDLHALYGKPVTMFAKRLGRASATAPGMFTAPLMTIVSAMLAPGSRIIVLPGEQPSFCP